MDNLRSSRDLLIDVVQELSLARSLERITEITRSAARRLAAADGATFVLRDNESCHYVDEDAIAPLWKGLKFPLTACVSGWAMLNAKSVAIPDIFADFRVPIAAYRPTFVRSLFMTPIRRIDPIGAIGVYWARSHAPSDDEINLLEALANATSVALQNVELHMDLQRKVVELERAAEAKDQFLLTLSHELRTPMNSIIGWSEILREDADQLTPEGREGIEAIHRNARVEMRLIGDLLDSTQALVGRLKLVEGPIDLGEVVRSAARTARVLAADRGITLTLRELISEAPMTGDADRLGQVLTNLLTNAAKFTPAGGQIILTIAADGPEYVITVEDDGEGIAADLLPRIFDRFQTQSDRPDRRHGGLGLGLAIVKSMVDAHGGRVRAYSAGPGQGSRFEVHLPHRTKVRGVPRLCPVDA